MREAISEFFLVCLICGFYALKRALTCLSPIYSRDDKRYTEKKNKTERARRKKEDTARLRGIVDSALALDPRIKRIKDEEKAAREAKKKSKSGTATPTNAKAQAEEEKRKAEEEAKQKEEEDKVRSLFFFSGPGPLY